MKKYHIKNLNDGPEKQARIKAKQAEKADIARLLTYVEEYARRGMIHETAINKLEDLGVKPSDHSKKHYMECSRLKALLETADNRRLKNNIKAGLLRIKRTKGRFWPEGTAQRIVSDMDKLSDRGLNVDNFRIKLSKLRNIFERRFVYASDQQQQEDPSGPSPF